MKSTDQIKQTNSKPTASATKKTTKAKSETPVVKKTVSSKLNTEMKAANKTINELRAAIHDVEDSVNSPWDILEIGMDSAFDTGGNPDE